MSSILQRSSDGDRPDPDEQQERSMELEGIRQSAHAQGDLREDILRYLGESDLRNDITEELRSLINKDWVLANLADAGYQELKWELRHLKESLYDTFPGPDCLVIGDDRAYINDDPNDTRRPLTEDDLKELEQTFRTIRLRLTRSKGMQQQRVLQTNVTQSEVLRADDDGGNRVLNKLRR